MREKVQDGVADADAECGIDENVEEIVCTCVAGESESTEVGQEDVDAVHECLANNLFRYIE